VKPQKPPEGTGDGNNFGDLPGPANIKVARINRTPQRIEFATGGKKQDKDLLGLQGQCTKAINQVVDIELISLFRAKSRCGTGLLM
jgi:hypothetical protein